MAVDEEVVRFDVFMGDIDRIVEVVKSFDDLSEEVLGSFNRKLFPVRAFVFLLFVFPELGLQKRSYIHVIEHQVKLLPGFIFDDFVKVDRVLVVEFLFDRDFPFELFDVADPLGLQDLYRVVLIV